MDLPQVCSERLTPKTFKIIRKAFKCCKVSDRIFAIKQFNLET